MNVPESGTDERPARHGPAARQPPGCARRVGPSCSPSICRTGRRSRPWSRSPSTCWTAPGDTRCARIQYLRNVRRAHLYSVSGVGDGLFRRPRLWAEQRRADCCGPGSDRFPVSLIFRGGLRDPYDGPLGDAKFTSIELASEDSVVEGSECLRDLVALTPVGRIIRFCSVRHWSA